MTVKVNAFRAGFILAGCLLGVAPLFAATLRVPADYPTFQSAVNTAASGDSVFVAAGSYAENVTVSGKSFALVGEQGAAATSVIAVRWLNSTPGQISTITGFTLSDSLVADSMDWLLRVSDVRIEAGLRVLAEVSQLSLPTTIEIEDATVLGSSRVTAHSNHATGILLARCAFHAPVALYASTSNLSVVQCQFQSAELTMWAEFDARASGCTFTDCGVSSSSALNGSWLRRCTFTGGSGINAGGWSCSVDSCSLSGTAGLRLQAGGSGSVTDCSITGGGGITAPSAVSSRIERNHISGCTTGISTSTGTPVLRNNLISECQTGVAFDGNAYMDSNVIWNCTSGVVMRSYYAEIGHNTIAGCSGDGIRTTPVSAGTYSVFSNILASNGTGIRFLSPPGPNSTVTCNDVWNNSGGDWIGIADPTDANGNISADPLFCDTAASDYHLNGASPCFPGQRPDGFTCGSLTGALGMGCGTVKVNASTWGRIKAQFR